MAAVARYLADKSALVRLHHPPVAAALGPLIEAGLVATCPMIEFEMLWSTRSPREFAEVRGDRSVGYEWLAIDDRDWRRAIDVMADLWSSGRLRSVPLPDLLIAATAERHRVSVLHYDAGYDVIAGITAACGVGRTRRLRPLAATGFAVVVAQSEPLECHVSVARKSAPGGGVKL